MFRSKSLLCSCGLAPASDAHHTCRFRGPPVFVRNSVDTHCQENCRPQVWLRWRVTLLSKNKPQAYMRALNYPRGIFDYICGRSRAMCSEFITKTVCQLRSPLTSPAGLQLSNDIDSDMPGLRQTKTVWMERLHCRQSKLGLLFCVCSLAPASDAHHTCRFRGPPVFVRNSVDTRCQENCRPQVWFRWRVTLLSKNKPQAYMRALNYPRGIFDYICGRSRAMCSEFITKTVCQLRSPLTSPAGLQLSNDIDSDMPGLRQTKTVWMERLHCRQSKLGLLFCVCSLAPASDAHHTCRFRGPPVFVRNSVDTRCQENCRPQVWFRWRVTFEQEQATVQFICSTTARERHSRD